MWIVTVISVTKIFKSPDQGSSETTKLIKMDQEQLQNLTQSYLQTTISLVSETVDSTFDPETPFGELGIDSFYVLKILRRLENDFGPLPKTLMFEHFNVSDLSSYFIKNYTDHLANLFSEQLDGVSDQAISAEPVLAEAKAPARRGVATNEENVKSHAIRALEKDILNDVALGPVIENIYDRYKNESSVSRGTRNIAPNLFVGSDKKGYFNYSRFGTLILAYAYTGPEGYFKVLVKEFHQYCLSKNLELNLFYEEELGSIHGDLFSSTPFGVIQRVLNLQEFTLKGQAMRRLRYQVSKFEKQGSCRTTEYKTGDDAKVDKDIANVIDQWCAQKVTVNPLIQIVKREILAGELDAQHRVFLTYMDDTLQNVILISKMSEDQNGYLMDLEFYPEGMPLGGLEYAIVNIVRVLIEEGCDLLSLGGTYGCKLEMSASADPDIDKILDDLRTQNIFNDEGNLQFKNKFRPENKTIYVCRPINASNAENVLDLIMMIADPEKMQTSDVENHNLILPQQSEEPVLGSDLKDAQRERPAKSVATVNNNKSLSISEKPIKGGQQRLAMLSDAGFNPVRVSDQYVDFDLKTDSWAQLSLPIIEERTQYLHSMLQVPVSVDERLKEIFPFKHFVLTESGRAAESILCQAWDNSKGIVLQDLLFPTWIFSQIENDFTPEEIPSEVIFNLNANDQYKPGIDLGKLQSILNDKSDDVAFVCIEVNNNAAGGYPVAIEYLQALKTLLDKYRVPLVMDGTRVLENAYAIVESNESDEEHSVWSITKDIFSFADVLTMSLAKDFCINKGGLVATNDEQIYRKLKDLSEDSGLSLDLIDKKTVALSIGELGFIEQKVYARIIQVRKIWLTLEQAGIPVVKPAGSHCVLIDVAQVDIFQDHKNPVADFIAWVFLNTGIRCAQHSVGMQKGTSLNQLVRFAIPVGMTDMAADSIAEKLISSFVESINIPVLDCIDAHPNGDVFAEYDLLELKNTFLDEEGPAEVEEPVKQPNSSGEQMPPAIESQQHVKQQVPAASLNKTEAMDIAIVGMAGRYAGAKNVDELWKNLVDGKDCISEISDERFQRRRQRSSSEKYRGGFIDDLDRFDSLFFNISPREAETLDPQERLFLEVAWEALEDAGYYPENLNADDGTRNIGVYVGAVWTLYQTVGAEERLADNYAIANSFLWSIANRVSYYMNLPGPSIAVDTACSASLTAIYLAAEAIRKGDCSSALVGAVNLDVHQTKQEITVAGGLLSEEGLCRTFGKNASGYVPGEGVGAIYLKPLEQAERDRDNIYAVIKSAAINHGGRTSGYSVPSPKAQSSLISKALNQANIDARSIGYVEAHGTGTELGDPIEITGLTSAFEDYGVAKQSCSIGSIKTNVGHLEAAAGLVGVSKVLLQMKHGSLVPSLHSNELNEFIDFDATPFVVQQNVEPWLGKEVDGQHFPLRAGVSSFGAGGSNAHVILEKYEYLDDNGIDDGAESFIIPLSARTEGQLKDLALRLKAFIEVDLEKPSSEQARMADIAYTTQYGRKPFEYRLAFVARDKRSLVDKLAAFSNAKNYNEFLFGNIKNANSITKLLGKKEKAEFIKLICKGGELDKVAQLWTDGVISDWGEHQTTKLGRRISLPTYPFADKRHWIPDAGESNYTLGEADRRSAPVLHPLIDTNESTFERQIFKKTFTDQEFFIYDHLVSDIPTLPGVAYLDFARKAGEIAAGRRVSKIKNILWVSPLTVEDSIPNEVFIELKPSGNLVQFEIFSNADDGRKQLYSQGKLEFDGETGEQAADEFVDLDDIRQRSKLVIEKEAAYPLFKSLGLHLGPTFQALKSVYKNDEEVLGELALPEGDETRFDEFILHPSLVDSAFQAVMGAQLSGDQSGGMVVPYSLGEVEIVHPLTRKCFSYVTESENKKEGSGLSKKNALIVDESGKVLVRVRDSVGVALTDVHEKPQTLEADGNNAEGDVGGFEKLFYSLNWCEQPVINIVDEPLDSTLIFAPNNELLDLYQQHFDSDKSALNKLILIQPGTTYQNLNDGVYQIDPSSKADFSRLMEELEEKGVSIRNILFAWSLADKGMPGEYRNWLPDSLANGVYAFLYLCQTIIERKQEDKVRLQYTYLTTDQVTGSHHEAVNGFATILSAESPRFWCKVHEVQQEQLDLDQAFITAVEREFNSDAKDELTVRTRDSQRYVRKIEELVDGAFEESPSSSHFGLKEGGVYIITGGAGGLGLIFAQYMSQQCKARLVLTGRSELDDERQKKIKALEEFGSEVEYIVADVANAEDVSRLVESTKSRFGQLNGVIHSAGVLRDSYVRNKTEDEMSAVLSAKVDGTLNLDYELRDENLDFFVMFSSLAAIVGNPGQCDYSFANHFMDSFAREREGLRAQGLRRGKTISINWSIWAEGGMQLDEQTEIFFRKNLGIKPLSADVGISAFIQGLKSTETNFTVIEGVKDKIEVAWGLREEQKKEAEELTQGSENNEGTESGIEDEALTMAVRAALTGIVMDFLKLDEEDIDIDSILLDLGFDSIGLTTFSNAVNDKYDLDITPVLFFEYPNIREISAYMASEFTDNVSKVHGESSKTSAVANKANGPSTTTQSEQTEEIFSSKKSFQVDANTQTIRASTENDALSMQRRFVEKPIAIVGMSGVMPQSDNINEFWENLRNAKDTMVTEIPRDRWKWEDYYGDPLIEENKTKSKWGGFMREVDKFDPLFWGLSPREAEMMDPQQRIFLETVWNAVEDSGHRVSDLAGTRTGLFVGAATRDYIDLMGALDVELDGYSASGTSHAVLANRVSFMLDINGPSAPLDTACSSSLVALHRAIESIHTGSCDMAIIGGVQVMLTPAAFISFGAAGMLAADGKCKTFDARADGYVRGEGSGAIFIKPLEMAEDDGDHIYAIVKATAENHGGKATMLTAPNPNAQADLLFEAYQKAEVDPTSVGYIECHGTGTSLGDPIEMQSMKKAFSRLYKEHNKGKAEKPHIGLTSVKTNIGHLETAAGIAGLLKVLLSIKHKQIPALLHYQTLNPYIDLKGTPFYMVDETQEWEAIKRPDGTDYPRRAGVSSFGFGGANAHIVLEEYIAPQVSDQLSPIGPYPIVLSAKDDERLKVYAGDMLASLAKEEVDISRFAYTLQEGRDEMAVRMAFLSDSIDDVKIKLAAFIDGDIEENKIFAGKATKKTIPDVTKESVDNLLSEIQFEKIIELWVAGATINWNKIYGDKKPRRLSLPTYPFARERYWFEPGKAYNEHGLGQAAILHPLLHANVSTLEKHCYRSYFSDNDDFIKDYNLNGQPSLPVSAYIEMVSKAIAIAQPQEDNVTAELFDIDFVPLSCSNEKDLLLTSIYESENGQLEYDIVSRPSSSEISDNDLLLCEGFAHWVDDSHVNYLDISQIESQMSRGRLDMEQVFTALNQLGVVYGDSLRCINSMSIGDSQCLLKFSDLDSKSSLQVGDGINPAVLESVIQASTYLLFASGEVNQHLLIPSALESLRIYSKPSHPELWAWVRRSRHQAERGPGYYSFDIDILSPEGETVLALKSFTMKKEGVELAHNVGIDAQQNFKQILDSIYEFDSATDKESEDKTDSFENLINQIY